MEKRKYAQIIEKKAWWIFESAEYPSEETYPTAKFVDITDITPQPLEGWLYYPELGGRFAPPEKPIDPIQEAVDAYTLELVKEGIL